MTETTEQPLDESQELFNEIFTATFSGEDGDYLVFDLENDQKALVSREEFGDSLPFSVGAQTQILVEDQIGDMWSASVTKVEKLKVWDWLDALTKSDELIDGHILGENKGGLTVDIGLRAFLPRSQVDLHRVDDVTPYIGRTEKFNVISFDKKRGNVVVSRRRYLESLRKEQRQELVQEIEPGQKFEGVVRNLTSYGAFVDIGGIDGLLHVSNMSWGRVDDPSEMVRPGDKVNVVVLDYDAKKKRLSLGRKQLLQDPWQEVADKYNEGDIVEGRVVSLADFGAFVEIAPGLEGLVHVTELAWTGRINHPKEVLSLEQAVQVKITSIDIESRRMGLSIKQLSENPWEKLAETLEIGAKVDGAIRNITDFGLFVEIAPAIEGLVHTSDLSWTDKTINPSEHYKVGQEIEVVVLDIDVESERISLGIKQLTEDPWNAAIEKAKVGSKISVEITKLTQFGAFAQIVEGVEGLIHVSELSQERVENVAEVVRPGQTVEVLVIGFDRDNERISLSLKRDELPEEGDDMREYTDDIGTASTLGDLLRDRLGIAGDDQDGAPAENAAPAAEPTGDEQDNGEDGIIDSDSQQNSDESDKETT